jgi:hypothetical protein
MYFVSGSRGSADASERRGKGQRTSRGVGLRCSERRSPAKRGACARGGARDCHPRRPGPSRHGSSADADARE